MGSWQTSSKAKSGGYAQVDKRVCVTVCVYTIDGPLFYYLHIPISLPPCRVPQVLTAEQQRAFCRIGAIIRGFLTRRLLKTEKIKHLRQTVVVR